VGGNLVMQSGSALWFRGVDGRDAGVVIANVIAPLVIDPNGIGWFLASIPGMALGPTLWRTNGTPSGTGPVGGPDGGFPCSTQVFATTASAVFLRAFVPASGDGRRNGRWS
jgi:hypothetical protein